MSLNNLGNRLSELGRREQALTHTEEATDIYRRLADTNPDTYLPNLAMSLNNLGILLSELGRREQALTHTEEATDIYRRLADTNPDTYLP
ncbi:tetratricopeptide repeat protein, partial [Micromonospora wenchangensis]